MSLLALGCGKDSGADASSGADGISSGIGGDGDSDSEGGDSDPDTGSPKLDMDSEDTDMLPCGEGELCECDIPPHTPCDGPANTPVVQALGLNCPGDPTVTFATTGAAAGIGTRSSFGNLGAFPPQEGSQYVVIGSGAVAELDDNSGLGACNSDLGAYDPGSLPAPLVGADVGAQTCAENPALVGMGDCSNTIEAQLAGSVNDYTELRITATVPDFVNSFSYNLAYFSYEYPEYYQSVFNDMYIGWLESEVWTGNVSFDEFGAPISLNAGFLDYRDANSDNDPDCQGGCSAPELHGTCMEGHAGTKWLTTTAGVKPGETITLVLAIFDMSDSVLDSYAFIDNFQWGCDGDQPPSTTPIE
ncbi:choice-of-anchor L domain-containing protein [Enhygromyxa salina]|uniref:choice-of-anchor L domain-containing protein n=1 Tax=Enhygromyxa salina TaxID=215803 RepID=UPI000D08A97B|nr:choice-of-anchor L domain-containing protein [Enhygromyxa salina]